MLMIAPNPPTVVTVSTIRLSAAIALTVVWSRLSGGVRMARDTQSRNRNPMAPTRPSLAVRFSFWVKPPLAVAHHPGTNGEIGFSACGNSRCRIFRPYVSVSAGRL